LLEDSETNTRLHILLTLGLTLALRSRIEVRMLTNAHAALTGTKANAIVVVSSSMVGRADVPDSCFG
jgi:hypothetical protein